MAIRWLSSARGTSWNSWHSMTSHPWLLFKGGWIASSSEFAALLTHYASKTRYSSNREIE